MLEGLRELRRLAAACALAAGAAAVASPLPAAPAAARPDENDVLYRPVVDVRLADVSGRSYRLSELWRRRPLVLAMSFSGCAEICPAFLASLAQAVRAVGGAGRRYDVVIASFDPRDTAAGMAAMARAHGLAAAPGWHFGVTSPGEAARLARSIDFWTRWDPERRQFDHPAMLAAVDQGRVVRLLVGATVAPARLREVIWDLDHKLVPTYPLPSDRVRFRCFGYDPRSGGLAIDWGLALLLLPGLFMVATTACIFAGAGRRSASPRL